MDLLNTPLFEGEHVLFAPIDHEKDAEIEARWSHNSEYLRMLSAEPIKPLSAEHVKKRYENLEKEAEEGNRLFHFAIRTRPQGDEAGRLVGFARVNWIEWSNGQAYFQLGIGDPNDWGQGYGKDALRLLLRFAFGELNLHRFSTVVPEYNERALRMLQKAGFVEEVRRREAIHRGGRRWDAVHMGMLRSEWQAAAG